jgi:hypothetical protein
MKKTSQYTYPCNNCQRLDGDELGPSCPKQPDGLPFKDRVYYCKCKSKRRPNNESWTIKDKLDVFSL